MREPGDGCWPPNCSQNQIPLATSIVAHAGNLIMLGDGPSNRMIYESPDGLSWKGYEHDASWGVRYGAADASYRGALWRVGGFTENGEVRTPLNDVWRSVDGKIWSQVTEHAPWHPRARAHLVVFRDTLRLVGGEPADSVIWSTTDGKTWTAGPAAALSGNPQGVLVYRDALWIIGHGSWKTAVNDVWKSADARSWSRVTDHAQWSPRTGAGFGVIRDAMWVVGGAGHRDAWHSSDGRDWKKLDEEIPGPPRACNYSVVFKDRFWVVGGKTGGLGGTGFWDGICYLE